MAPPHKCPAPYFKTLCKRLEHVRQHLRDTHKLDEAAINTLLNGQVENAQRGFGTWDSLPDFCQPFINLGSQAIYPLNLTSNNYGYISMYAEVPTKAQTDSLRLGDSVAGSCPRPAGDVFSGHNIWSSQASISSRTFKPEASVGYGNSPWRAVFSIMALATGFGATNTCMGNPALRNIKLESLGILPTES